VLAAQAALTTRIALAADEKPAALEQVVVTGTLLRRENSDTPSPITVICAADIQNSGLTTIADVVRSLIQGQPGQDSSANDLDSIDFRATRTLLTLPGGPLGLGLGVEARYESQFDSARNPSLDVQGLGIKPHGATT
jgi:outer membrane receptor for ferrienterochelin and colicin